MDLGSYQGTSSLPFGSVVSHNWHHSYCPNIYQHRKREHFCCKEVGVPTSSRKVVNLPLKLFCGKNSWGYPTDHFLVSQGCLNCFWGLKTSCALKSVLNTAPKLHAKPLPALPLLRWNSPHSAGHWVAGLHAWVQSPHVAVTTRPTLKSPWRNGELIGEPTHPRFDVCLQTFSWVSYHLNSKQESESLQIAISFDFYIHLCCLCLFNPVVFCQSW